MEEKPKCIPNSRIYSVFSRVFLHLEVGAIYIVESVSVLFHRPFYPRFTNFLLSSSTVLCTSFAFSRFLLSSLFLCHSLNNTELGRVAITN
jgi:hypothetical protein